MSILDSVTRYFKKRILTPDQENVLIHAIKQAEQKTSGEIRVHIEGKNSTDPILKAQEIFKKLNMHQTKERNAILFYLSVHTKQFAIWGDEGIHQQVTQAFWDDITQVCVSNFKQDLLIEGLEAGISLCGEKLKQYFPLQMDDTNELSNEISY